MLLELFPSIDEPYEREEEFEDINVHLTDILKQYMEYVVE